MITKERFDELVAKAIENLRGGFTEFDGWNCHEVGYDYTDACQGWDGESYRCDCGNRRVAWEHLGGDHVGGVAH